MQQGRRDLLRAALAAAPALALAACGGRPGEGATRRVDGPAGGFPKRHARFATSLKVDGPSPSAWEERAPPEGVTALRYPSGALELKAWYAPPPDGAPAPALVFFHNDFVFRPAAFAATRPFRDAGFAVMTPTLRGENGNPGRFELLRGELDDARAAARWLAARPEVDGARVYAFGHSIGGGVAAMLSLFDDVTLARTGSCGGLYVPETFARWAESRSNRRLIRFDPQDRREREMRVLGPHVADMVHEHVAYIGDEDPWFIENAAAIQARAQAVGAPLTIERVPGDHMSSLAPALEGFLQRARADA